jgi:hypothetical protein
MADNPDARPPEGLIIPVSDTPHAPFIFYEIAPAFGFTNGVVNVTLSANRTWIADGKVLNEQVVVAYLRGNVQAALSLRMLSIARCCPPSRPAHSVFVLFARPGVQRKLKARRFRGDAMIQSNGPKRMLGSANGMVRPCSCPASKLRWQGAPKTRSTLCLRNSTPQSP